MLKRWKCHVHVLISGYIMKVILTQLSSLHLKREQACAPSWPIKYVDYNLTVNLRCFDCAMQACLVVIHKLEMNSAADPELTSAYDYA